MPASDNNLLGFCLQNATFNKTTNRLFGGGAEVNALEMGNENGERNNFQEKEQFKKNVCQDESEQGGRILEMYMRTTGMRQRAELKWMLSIVRDREKLAERKA